MKTEDFKNAPMAVKSLREPIDSVADLLSAEVAAARAIGNTELAREADKLKNNFDYMLRYLVRNELPGLGQTTDSILRQAERLRKDILLEYNILNSQRSHYASLRYQRRRPEENLDSLVSDYLSELTRRRDDPTAMMSNTANAKLEEISADIFERLRTAPHIEDHSQLIESIIYDNDIPSTDRVLWTGGIGFGLIEMPDDRQRFDMLASLLEKAEGATRVAAAVWLAVGALINVDEAHELLLTPKTNSGAELFKEALFEILRLDAVSRMSEADRREVIPSLEDFARKMQNFNNMGQIQEMMKNPESIAGQPGMYDWLHRFQKAVQDGYDVQEQTLGRMRHWNFFGKLANWLLPYDANHSALSGIADEEGAPLADMLSKISALIAPDKYALILSLSSLPPQMRAGAMRMNMEQMGGGTPEEIEEALDEEARESAKALTLLRNYAKQVWRIFTTHSQKEELRPEQIILPGDLVFNDRSFPGDEWLRRTGVALLHLKDYENAEGLFRSIFEPNPADTRNLALTLLRGSLWSYDETVYNYVESYPDDIDFLIEAANRGFEPRLLLKAFRENELNAPDSIEFLKAFALVLEKSSEYDDAISQVMALEYLDADNALQYQHDRARLLLLNGQFAEAAEALNEIHGNDAQFVAEKAFADWMNGNRIAAMELLERHKSNHELSNILDSLHQGMKSDLPRDQKALANYLIDAWHYILDNSNPLNS